MDFETFKEQNGNAPRLRLAEVEVIEVREFVQIIDLGLLIPSRKLQSAVKNPLYGDVHVGDCDLGLLVTPGAVWGAYRCLGKCDFDGAWCWLLALPLQFGQYSADARGTYSCEEDIKGWQACAHHSLTMDVAIYSFWQAVSERFEN